MNPRLDLLRLGAVPLPARPVHRRPWDVSTYGHNYSGSISVSSATLASDNTVYAQLTLDVGPENVAEMAHRLGVADRRSTRCPSIGLGSTRVSPLDMASAYATLAAGGIYSKPMAIRKVVLANGKEDTDAGWGKPQRKRVIPDGVAYEVTKILEENMLGGTGVGALLRPARRGQDRHDRQPRRRVVLRLHAAARDDGLGRLPAGRDPDGERARDLGRGRHLPGDDLAPVHGGGDGECAGARLARSR